jgi:hypothetical protein
MNLYPIVARLVPALLSVVITSAIAFVFEFGHLA